MVRPLSFIEHASYAVYLIANIHKPMCHLSIRHRLLTLGYKKLANLLLSVVNVNVSINVIVHGLIRLADERLVVRINLTNLIQQTDGESIIRNVALRVYSSREVDFQVGSDNETKLKRDRVLDGLCILHLSIIISISIGINIRLLLHFLRSLILILSCLFCLNGNSEDLNSFSLNIEEVKILSHRIDERQNGGELL